MSTATQVTTCHVRGGSWRAFSSSTTTQRFECPRPAARADGPRSADCGHGEAGLKIWREQGADLVITDLCMPDMSGLELIVQLRAFAPDLPVLAMSGGLESQRGWD